MKDISKSLIEQDIAKAKALSKGICILLGLAFAFIILPVAFSYRPPNETPGAWWARFGSLVTIFALYSQVQINKLGNLVAARGYGNLERINALRPYGAKLPYLNVASFIAVVLGTLIWGFGDLLI